MAAVRGLPEQTAQRAVPVAAASDRHPGSDHRQSGGSGAESGMDLLIHHQRGHQ